MVVNDVEKVKEWTSSLASYINKEFENNGLFFDFNENPYKIDAWTTGYTNTCAAELHLGAKSMPEGVLPSDDKVLELFVRDIIKDFVSKSQCIDDSEMYIRVYASLYTRPATCFVQGHGVFKDIWAVITAYIYQIKVVE